MRDYLRILRLEFSMNYCLIRGSRGSVLGTGRYGVQIPVCARYFLFLKNVQNGSRANPTSYSMGTGFFPEGKADEI